MKEQPLPRSVPSVPLFGAALYGILYAIAARLPETVEGAMLAVIAVLALALTLQRAERPALLAFFGGVVFHAIAFSWIPYTARFFGGFSDGLSYAVFALFCVLSSVQFFLCGLFVRWTRGRVPIGLSLGGAWLATEYLVPRMFPWALVHPLLPWSELAMFSSLVGVYPLSALFLFWSGVFLDALQRRSWRKLSLALAIPLLIQLLGVQLVSKRSLEMANAPALRVGVIQGNLDAKAKGDLKLFDVNLERYASLSERAIADGAEFIVWPEAVVNRWLPERLKSVRGTPLDPSPSLTVPTLYGGLSYRLKPGEQNEGSRKQTDYLRFNSAIGIDSVGLVTGVYHKRILMPFGEYMPFAETFPELREISPHTGNLDRGDVLDPISFLLPVGADGAVENIGVGVLICYEDLVPEMSRVAVRRGAKLLVNLTNDAWYGVSAAPLQHHMLAAWRAVESGRFFIRATNTGFTGIVNPLGETVAVLPLFEPAYVLESVALLETKTVYAEYGDISTKVLLALFLLVGIISRARARKLSVT